MSAGRSRRPVREFSPTFQRFAGKSISAPHFSARSIQRGLMGLIRANFLRSRPSFQLLLAVNRLLHFVETFPIDQPIAPILTRESFELAAPVFAHPALGIVRHSGVES